MYGRVCALLLTFFSFVLAHADETKDLQKHLQDRLAKKVLVIRDFYGGGHLVFDKQGKLVRGAEDDCWCAAQIEIRKVQVKDNFLLLRGPRVLGRYNAAKKAFTQLFRLEEQLQIDIELDPAHKDEATIVGTLVKVFITSGDNLDNLIPESPKNPPVPAINEIAMKAASRIPPGVKPPKATYSPDPEYSEKARTLKRQGDIVLWVAIDKEGHVADTKIIDCLGAGLDEKAIEAVSKWKFEPAQKNGAPVAVQVNVDINFHMYR